MWKYREQLSYYDKLRRSIYEILRDALERRLMKISLIDSFYNYQKNKAEYSFVEKSELKPKSKKMEKESEYFNTFLVIACEGVLSTELKNYIRFFPENSVIKKNLRYLPQFTLYKQFHRNLRYFDSPRFLDLVEQLLDVDYALLIQQDASVKKKNRYALTHFHVKIDWPISDASEDLAKWLRYIQNHLYENGEKEARVFQNKLFEYYGCHHTAGGRRTAGLIAAQLLRKLDSISTVFVSSAEARTMYRYSERGVSKFFLIQLTDKQLGSLAKAQNTTVESLQSSYFFDGNGPGLVGILEASYSYTTHSKPPKDGKLRKIRPAYNWLTLKDELLHPKLDAPQATPIRYSWVYASDD
ncbi:MAG: hypothetical protein J7M32_02055 [Deltaproteobacteria bacterium]|nr:hypothetical protein [Deltaproteobacteria bacterium]